MAIKGALAKQNLIDKFIAAVGVNNYVGTADNKYYFWSSENGERMQIAVTLTNPKTPLAQAGNLDFDNGRDFSKIAAAPAVNTAPATEITEAEKKNLADLLASLGL